MPDQEDETTETGPTVAEVAERQDRLESKVDMILDKLGGARDTAHEHAQQHTEERLDRPTSIADEIRQQLAAQRAKDEADAAGRDTADRLGRMEVSVAELTEKVPEPPQRRIEKIMGWR